MATGKKVKKFTITVTGDSGVDIHPEDVAKSLNDIIAIDKIEVTREESLDFREPVI